MKEKRDKFSEAEWFVIRLTSLVCLIATSTVLIILAIKEVIRHCL